MGTPPPKGKEVVCSNCGLVQGCASVEDDVNDDDLSSLVGTGIEQHLRHVDYLGSSIGYRESRCFRDGNGRALAPPLQDRFLHLKLYNEGKRYGNYAHIRTIRSLIEVADGLSMCEDVKTQALYKYKKAVRKGFRRSGVSTISMAAFCLLQANRSNGGRLVALKDIVEAFRTRGHRIAPFDLMDAGLVYRQLLSEKPKILRSEDLMARAVGLITADREVISASSTIKDGATKFQEDLLTRGYELLGRLRSIHRGGRKPLITAIAAIYAADRLLAKEERRKPVLTQQRLAKIAGISEYSIREHLRVLFKAPLVP